MLCNKELYEFFIDPLITVVIKTDSMMGQCIGLAVVTVKGKENSEL